MTTKPEIKGNGVDDNTAAIQAMIDAGKSDLADVFQEAAKEVRYLVSWETPDELIP